MDTENMYEKYVASSLATYMNTWMIFITYMYSVFCIELCTWWQLNCTFTSYTNWHQRRDIIPHTIILSKTVSRQYIHKLPIEPFWKSIINSMDFQIKFSNKIFFKTAYSCFAWYDTVYN